MSALIFPRTDVGVLLQVALVVAASGVALWRLWAHPEARVLVAGTTLMLLSLIGLRGAH